MREKRRGIVRPRGAQPMYVIAGLPKSRNKDAVDALQARRPDAIVQGIPSSDRDGALYPLSLREALVRSVGAFAIRRRGDGHAPVTPASITLFFVPSSDQAELLDAFNFAVMAAPLPTLVAWDEHGRQLRHDREAIDAALIAAVSPSGRAKADLDVVQWRLNFQSDNEALLLPPENFFTKDGDLVPVFRAFRDGERPWTDRLADYGPTELTHEDVPKRVAAQQTRRPYVDSRSMAFFIAHPKAYDGPAREVGEEERPAAILSVLRSLYRFGGALPPGIHHDVQRRDGSSLGGADFICSRKGPISSKADYANIYPDDFVRVADVRDD